MTQAVFDTSAVLAWLHTEPGSDLVAQFIPSAVLSSVNAAEVQSKLVRDGVDPKVAWESVVASVSQIIPFNAAQAEAAGSLIAQTQPHGLSLGDRACLALAFSLNAPVYTTDRAWAQVKIGVEIRLVR
jgi:ribonuclease VapC